MFNIECLLNCFKCKKKKNQTKNLKENLHNSENTHGDSINLSNSHTNPIIATTQNQNNLIKNNEKVIVNSSNSSLISETDSNTHDNHIKFSEQGLNQNEIIGDDEPLLREDSPLICDYEKGVITFTRNGLIKMFDSFWNLDDYKSVWDKEDLTIEVRYSGTPMNDKFYLIKIIYKLNKSDLKYNKDPQSIMDYCYDIKLRNLWDDGLKLLEKIEGNDINYIVNTWGKSPVFFVSERETFEKRFRFDKDGNYYVMSTSIPLDLYPPKKDVVRFVDFLNFFKISEEDEYIVFSSLNQCDFKMSIPQMLINITLPMTSKNWYAGIKKFANSIEYDVKNKIIIKKHEEEDE